MTKTEPIGYGVIGAGSRANCLLTHLSKHEGVELLGVCDVVSQRVHEARRLFGTAQTTVYSDYDQMLANPGIDWIIIATPNYLHKAHIMAAFAAGKHVFAEKPLATTIDDCIAINRAHRKSGDRLFATGFVLRYSPLYRMARELLLAGEIGTLIAIEANENIPAQHSGHIMTCGWRCHGEYSGGHMLEKCCHDLDLLNWLIDDVPARVASFGGRRIFTPENAGNLHKFTPRPGASSVYLEWPKPGRDTQDPFTSDKSIVDHQVSILQYGNGVCVTFHVTMNNALPERRMYLTGTEGTMILDPIAGRITLRRIGHQEPTRMYEFGGDGHGGADPIIVRELVQTMMHQTPPICSGNEGLRSAVAALMLENSRMEGNVVSLAETWKSVEDE